MQYLFIILSFVFGLVFGSFINCLVWRLHKNESLLNRSYCPKCGKKIAWYDNIPVLSFVLLLAKCRHCKSKISFQYPLIELLTAALFVVAFIVNSCNFSGNTEFLIFNLQFLNNTPLILDSKFLILLFRDWFVISVMIVIFIYDLRWYLILDIVTLPACVIVFIVNLMLGFNWQNLLISGIIGGSFFLIQFVLSRGRWIGGGDIRLGLLIGLILGWPNILVAIFLAYLVGAIISVFLVVVSKKKWESKIPLGIFLSVATIITLFWGDAILDWYLYQVLSI